MWAGYGKQGIKLEWIEPYIIIVLECLLQTLTFGYPVSECS